MSRRSKSAPGGLCAYFVEIQEQDGKYTVSSDYSFLVSKCIEDKIFSENTDLVSICRSDTTSSLTFVPCDWDGLRRALAVLNETRLNEDDLGGRSIENPITCLTDIIAAMDAQMQQDSYEDRKILFFASLSSYILDLSETTRVADKLLEKDVFLSIVLPNKEDMSDIQRDNLKVLKKVFGQDKYGDVSCVMNLRRAQIQIMNTQTKRLSRPSPWNVPFEISPKITISVSGFVCTRANVVKDMKKVFTTKGWFESSEAAATPSQSMGPSTSGDSHSNGSGSQMSTSVRGNTDDVAAEPTLDLEEAKRVIEKEKFWTTKDGERVDEDVIGKAYYFADKLVQCSENEESYQTGEKCLKLLAFIPLENVHFAFLMGNGTTVFYPRKDDKQAEVIFNALLDSMMSLQRIAIVRKVYRKNSKCVLGILYPDKNRGCLVQNELCYSDDISIPQFPSLVKGKDGSTTLSTKEELIDNLIAEKSLDKFSPFEGPADPAVAVLRERIASKILKRCPDDSKDKPLDNIGVYFQNLVLSSDLLDKLRDTFVLKENKNHERPAGANIFRKRSLKEEELAEEAEKRLKLDEEDAKNEKQESIDDLLDEL